MAKLKSTISSPLFGGLRKEEYRPKEYIVGTICAIWSVPLTYFSYRKPLRSLLLRGAEIRRTYAPPRIPPERSYREYSILELLLAPLAGIDIVREEVEEKAHAEIMQDEIFNLKMRLETGEITEEEYQKKEMKLRATHRKR